MNITELLQKTIERGATDIHLTVGAPPTIRLDRALINLTDTPLRPDDTRELAKQVLDAEKLAQLARAGDLDVSYSSPGVGRFRVNIFHQRGTIGMAIRVINTVVPDISSLGLPDIVSKLALRQKGLILVTGPSNSGKSTTLAAIINLINEELPRHIITLEDPIEYLHKHKKSIVNQREIGLDSESFPLALRSALRQDPDVILVGELNEPQTIAMALTAAETGHMILSSLHSPEVVQGIERLVDVFSKDQKEQIRMMLANNLVGVVAQRLIPRKDGQGKVAAVEFMAISTTVRALIRDGKMEQLYTMMQSGVRSGMRSLDRHIQQLFEKDLISEEEVLDNALDRAAMSRFLSKAGISTKKAYPNPADEDEL